MKRGEHDDGNEHEPRAKFRKQSQETAPQSVEVESVEVRECVERHARDYHKTGAGNGKRKAKLKAGLSGGAQYNQ